MSIADGAILGVLIACVLAAVFKFFNVTLWQCRKFGNCPWYLEPVWGDK